MEGAAAAPRAAPEVAWELATSSLTDRYQALSLVATDLQGEPTEIPCVPVELTDFNLALMLPAAVMPWLPARLWPLADLETGLASADGMQVAVCGCRLSPERAQLMLAVEPGANAAPRWHASGRWPVAANVADLGMRDVSLAPKP